MTELRRIAPIPMPPDLVPASDFGGVPVLAWSDPTDLYVDGSYQRDMSRRSAALMKKMFEEFAWAHIKVPNVVEAKGKKLVIDGQHTAIVAACLRIKRIPILIVEAKEVAAQAHAFVGLNTDRVRVSPFDIYRALIRSGDEDAMDVDNVCKRAGVRIRHLSPTCVVAEGDTAALGTIQRLVRTRGVINSRKVLQTLVLAKRTPITPYEIRAVENILCKHRPDVEPERLARIIRSSGAFMDAKHRAQKAGIPIYRSLEDEWLARIKG